MKIAIQGEAASFHDVAAQAFYGPDIEVISCDSFKEAVAKLTSREADKALLATENSLYGSINEVYDLILNNKLWIIGEHYLRIKLALIGHEGVRLEDIEEVHSHPVALAQAEAFIDEKLHAAERFEAPDTAGSVAELAKSDNRKSAAIASKEAAQHYNMHVIEDGIETNKQNYTRFVALSREPEEPQEAANKSSLVLETAHTPGALYRALGVFAEKEINLSKLESRPIIGKAWHYMFYVDIEAGIHEERTKSALKILEEMGNTVTPLGSYVRHEM